MISWSKNLIHQNLKRFARENKSLRYIWVFIGNIWNAFRLDCNFSGYFSGLVVPQMLKNYILATYAKRDLRKMGKVLVSIGWQASWFSRLRAEERTVTTALSAGCPITDLCWCTMFLRPSVFHQWSCKELRVGHLPPIMSHRQAGLVGEATWIKFGCVVYAKAITLCLGSVPWELDCSAATELFTPQIHHPLYTNCYM